MPARFMCYIWEDLNTPGDVKFGDHWVEDAETFEDAVENTRKYIRGSLGRSKYKYDNGTVVIHHYWDASEYARKTDCFRKHGKVDDKLRHCIGGHIQSDFHCMPAETAVYRVNVELAKLGQPLPVAGLSPNQYSAAENVVDAVHAGKRTILAELCARFGKTIWAGAVMRETNAPLTIVATYVLTVTNSFQTDLSGFEQFKDMVQVDTKDENYQTKIDEALAQGKQVVAYLSMCNGTQRKPRIDYLFNLDVPKLLIVDEADFGSHQKKQAQPLIDARTDDDTVILMTGTNADKAASIWKVDHMLSVTYPELLMEKRLTQTV